MGPSIKGRSIRHLHVVFGDVICQVTTDIPLELDSKNDTASSDDSVSSEYINNMDQKIEEEMKMLRQQGAASIQ